MKLIKENGKLTIKAEHLDELKKFDNLSNVFQQQNIPCSIDYPNYCIKIKSSNIELIFEFIDKIFDIINGLKEMKDNFDYYNKIKKNI